MLEITKSPLFGITLSIISYIIGVKFKNKFKSPIFNPMMIGSLIIIGILYISKIPLENYMVGGNILAMLLAPATAVIAVLIYKRLDVIKKNALPVIIGCIIGSLSSLISVFLLCKLFSLPEEILASLLPKSITTAIASEVSARLGGIVPLTVAAVSVTGIFGAIMSPYFIKWFKIKNRIAAGLAIGASCHALGTAKAIEIGEIEGMVSGIAIGICGLSTVFMIIFI